MATALLVTTDDLKNNTIIDGNVDTAKFIQFMRIAQEVHIQNYLGTSLYRAIQAKIIAGTLTGDYLDLVNNYLKDMVIYFAMVDYVPLQRFKYQMEEYLNTGQKTAIQRQKRRLIH